MRAMSYLSSQFKQMLVFISSISMTEIACLHNFAQYEHSFLLILATYQILFLQSKLSVQYPHHRFCKPQHPKRLQSLSNFRYFCGICVTILQHKVVIHHLSQTNPLKQKMSVDMGKNKYPIKLQRWYSKALIL